MADKDGGTKWLIFDLINFFDLSWSVKAKFFFKQLCPQGGFTKMLTVTVILKKLCHRLNF